MNNQNIKEVALRFVNLGLSVLPVNQAKEPTAQGKNGCVRFSWNKYQSQIMTAQEIDRSFTGDCVKGLGIICGKISGGLEVIDIDTKYDLTGYLAEEYSNLIKDNLPELYDSLVIAQTQSGGYHLFYRCETLEGNQPTLAQRYTTEEDREEKYLENIQKHIAKGETEEEAERLATASRKNDKIRVLIETRGEGGYVASYPTPGYTFIQGEPENIPTITPEQRAILLRLAKDFDKVEPVPTPSTPPELKKTREEIRKKYNLKEGELTSLEDFDLRGGEAVINLLVENGWEVMRETSERIYLLRPGKAPENNEIIYSGNYHKEKRCLMIFSSSTIFEAGKPYGHSEILRVALSTTGEPLSWGKVAELCGRLGYGAYQPSKQDKQSKQAPPPHEAESLISIDYQEEGILITSPGAEARDEVMKAIAEIQQQTTERIYVLEDEYKRREYIYQLSDIFKRYGALQDELGGLTDEDIDRFLDEVVTGSANLEPIDKDIYLKRFLDSEGAKELGISQEALEITVDRLKTTREKEKQNSQLKKLLSEAKSLQDKGETGKALEILSQEVKDISLTVKATEFSKLLKPTTREDVVRRQAEKPPSLLSGFNIKDEPLEIPSGAITIISAPTSHGKTAMLSNIAVNVTRQYPDKDFYFFSYEEDSDTVLMNTLNTYLDYRLSHNNRKTLQTYFATGSTDYIKAEARDKFIQEEDRFFSELIDKGRLNIHYTSYDIDTLCDSIRYLKKHGKPGAIFIDYIQLINLPQGKYKTYSRQEQVKVICQSLKDVAVETGLPLILASQFNREVTNLLQIHPTKISEAGDIERVANTILGLWNNTIDHKGTESELEEIRERKYPTDSIYVKVLKRRGGVPGVEDYWKWNGNQNKIKDRDPSESSDSLSKAIKGEPYFN